jgi:hypothetical protein
MKDYLEGARKWVEDSADLNVEQIESVIETLGHKVTETPGLSSEATESIREAISFLNETLSSMTNAKPEERVHDSNEWMLGTGSGASNVDLDVSPLVPLEEKEPVKMSSDEKKRAVEELCNSGIITQGMKKAS